MRVIRREWRNVARIAEYHLYPIGDVHLGAAACDERQLRRLVEVIAGQDNAYWVGLGDYCDYINVRDPRFSAGTLASWVTVADLADLAKSQTDRFLGIVAPIASKCLCLLEGNHETAIARHSERHIFGEIVDGIRKAGGFDDKHSLALGYYGWLQLVFYGGEHTRSGCSMFNVNLHHGFTGGRLAGGKALNMQRWLWSHHCDLAIQGHSHNTGVQVEAVERIDQAGKVTYHDRYGIYAGTFLRTINDDGPATYAEVKGYLPMPTGNICVVLRPRAHGAKERIRVVTT